MKIYHFNLIKGKDNTFEGVQFPMFIDYIQSKGVKYLKGFCNKLNRYYVIIW